MTSDWVEVDRWYGLSFWSINDIHSLQSHKPQREGERIRGRRTEAITLSTRVGAPNPSRSRQPRCTTLLRRRKCPTTTMCRGAMRRRAASMHASSRRCAASAATRPASAASTASAAAATRPPWLQAKNTSRSKQDEDGGRTPSLTRD